MIEKTQNIFNFFIFFVVFLIILSIFASFSTKNYKEKRIKFYALFLNMSRREVVLMSSCVLSLLIVFYIILNISKLDNTMMYLLLANCIVFVLLSFNFRMTIVDLLYSSSMVLVLRLLYLVDSYLTNIYFDSTIYWLKVIFMILILLYSFLANLRKYDLVLTSNKYVRRNK